MLGLPKTTELHKIIPKKVFFAKFFLNTAEQKEFDNAIRQLVIVNEISSRTIPALNSKADDKAIYVLLVQLKQNNCEDKLINKLVKLIDQRIILALSYEQKLQLVIFHNKLIKDEMELVSNKKLILQGMSLTEVWDNLALGLAKIKIKTGQTIDEAIIADIQLQEIKKEVDTLTKKLWAEKQPKKKLELREQINNLKQKMEE